MREYAYWLAAAGCALAGCHNDDELLLSFDQLCSLRAENICSVRVPPCCAEDSRAPDCVEQETNACNAQREQIAGLESELHYDSQRASDKVDAELDALYQCEPPLALPHFFEGALALGAACKRDTQCESGRCGSDSRVCESADEVTLCPAE